MNYPETARRFAMAETSTRAGFTPAPETLAADKLPMSEWGEARRDILSPATIAANHALHVSTCADDLRSILNAFSDRPADPLALMDELQDATRALLAAIGEGGEG